MFYSPRVEQLHTPSFSLLYPLIAAMGLAVYFLNAPLLGLLHAWGLDVQLLFLPSRTSEAM